MENKKYIAKWGFGMAPISRTMRKRYDEAVQSVLDYILGNIALGEMSPEEISELKGMYNRCVREDQWDWFTVHAELGSPSKRDMRAIANGLKLLRLHALENNELAAEKAVQYLVRNGLLNGLLHYQGEYGGEAQQDGSGWVYILSVRESPKVLKIGMTTRSVSQRVKEINSATAVLYPLSARAVFRVRNASVAESEIFKILAAHRIRRDREFFDIPFDKAVENIREYIKKEDLSYMRSGEIIWFDEKKQFGFISDGTGSDVFVHASQVKREDMPAMNPGARVEYSVLIRIQGKLALDVRLAHSCAKRQ
ncbi:cold shock domain-containing protein [Pseudomonas aeruginosa]|uniref:cold shock domain-containing protein n=2 Tax=Pseudomonas aeruginosa TaxID=287 RepID=UPI00148BB97D|nr:cold shock domain-containing protein [Pseudomonas aeruginosa]